MKLQITCKEAVHKINKREEGRLSIWEHIQLYNHMAICSLCRFFAQSNRQMVKLFSGQKEAQAVFSDKEKDQMIKTLTAADADKN